MQITKTRNKKGLLEYYLADQPKTTSKQKSRLEKYEQKDLNFHCKHQFPEHYDSCFHIINESGKSGSAQYGAELNARGRKSGVPDWFVMVPIGKHHGLIVELKREYKKDGRPTPAEISFMQRQESLGYKCIIAYGFRAALIAINDYLTDNID